MTEKKESNDREHQSERDERREYNISLSNSIFMQCVVSPRCPLTVHICGRWKWCGGEA